jgi:hypothetical protein
MRALPILAVLCFAVSVQTACADTFHYVFQDPADSIAFTLNSGSLISSGRVINTTTCSAGAVSCVSAEISPGANGFVSVFADFTGEISVGSFHVTNDATFFTLGSHSFDGATLDITQVGATPEPSGIALLGTGLVGLVGMVRRRIVR